MLEELLPRWHFRERHGVRLEAPAAAAIVAAEEVTWAEVPVMRALMRVRSAGRLTMPADRTILDVMSRIGFTVLARTDEELVVGGIGRPWRVRGASGPRLRDAADPGAAFAEFDDIGWAKMIFNFRVASGALTTETRVLLTDEPSRRAFRRYWVVIRPFSGLIRRFWLDAVVRRAHAAGSPGGRFDA